MVFVVKETDAERAAQNTQEVVSAIALIMDKIELHKPEELANQPEARLDTPVELLDAENLAVAEPHQQLMLSAQEVPVLLHSHPSATLSATSSAPLPPSPPQTTQLSLSEAARLVGQENTESDVTAIVTSSPTLTVEVDSDEQIIYDPALATQIEEIAEDLTEAGDTPDTSLALTAVQQQQVIETVRAFLRHRGSNRYQGQHYAFSSQGSEVRVVATDGRGEILQASAERIQSSLLREDWNALKELGFCSNSNNGNEKR
jgi:hypothetical protein